MQICHINPALQRHAKKQQLYGKKYEKEREAG